MTILNLNQELAVLEVSGADAATYLQGQLTNDIRELSQQPFQYSAHLNNKGRILATFIISSHHDDSYYLITSKNVIDKIIPRLRMFIMRSKVVLNASNKNISLSNVPQQNCHQIQLTSETYLNIGDVSIGLEIDAKNEWHKFLVQHTIPMIYLESMEKIIPQQINYDLDPISGVNFKKGCYTGQEIVARTHYLGKVKRRMAKFTTDSLPAIGDTVVSPLLENQEIGFIIDYYQDEGKYHGLVSLQNNCLDSAYLDTANERRLYCQSLITETEGGLV